MIKNIILIGFRGCGKSTIAKKLSQKTGYRFVDLDIEIEKNFKKNITQITENGEKWEKFRIAEINTALKLFGFQKQIIAAGGGFGVNDVQIEDAKIKSLNHLSKQVQFQNYGELQTFILKQRPENFKIYLKLEELQLLQRLLKIYKKKENIEQRPLLNIQEKLEFSLEIEDWFLRENLDEDLKLRLKNDLANFIARKEKYESLADLTIFADGSDFDQKIDVFKV
jgi:shikimate kinase